MLNRCISSARAPVGLALGASCLATMSTRKGGAECGAEGAPKMPMRMLGNTGLQVSVLSYGFWATFGVKGDLQKQEGVEMAKACLRTARANGVNLFDNAEVYGNPFGEAERIMGEALAQLKKEEPDNWRRSDVIITTKLFWGGAGVNEKGLSVKHCREGLAASLKNLQIDYVDLVFCHRPDPLTPTETVVRGMSDLVRSGKAGAWGTSEWSAQQITEAFYLAKLHGLEPPQFEQPQYHLFHRERFESEYHPLFAAPYKMGTTIWSPLASGLLTGKYNDAVPEGSRLTATGYGWLVARLAEWKADGKIDKVRQLTAYAQKTFGCSVAQLSLAWCVKNPNVSTVLLGATKPSQLEENFGALRVARLLTDKHMAEIDAIVKSKPAQYMGFGGGGMRSIDTLEDQVASASAAAAK